MFEDPVNVVFSQKIFTESSNALGRKGPQEIIWSFSCITFCTWANPWKKCEQAAKYCPGLSLKDLEIWEQKDFLVFPMYFQKKIDVEIKSSRLWRNIWTLGQSPKPDLKKKKFKKNINMQWMFMKEAKLTSVNINRLCLRRAVGSLGSVQAGLR